MERCIGHSRMGETEDGGKPHRLVSVFQVWKQFPNEARIAHPCKGRRKSSLDEELLQDDELSGWLDDGPLIPLRMAD